MRAVSPSSLGLLLLLGSALSGAGSLVGCGGADFDVSAPVDDGGSDGSDATSDAPDSAPDSSTLDSSTADATDSGTPGETGDAGCAPLNACAGCKVLEFPPGTSCGACGSGKYVCDGKESTKCNDPITTPPETACGTCKTLKLKCAPDGLSTKCPGDDANACGGCTVLSPATGGSCGVCGGGKYVCAGAEATKCDDPVPASAAKPDTVCGVCGTSKYVCNTAKSDTLCALPDDRVAGTDTYDTDRTTSWDLSYGVSQRIAFTTKHKGAIHTLTMAVSKFAGGAGSGALELRLYTGKPDEPTAVLVTSTTFDPAAIPAGGGVGTGPTVDLKLPAPTPVYPAGTALFVELKGNSTAFNFQTEGGKTAVAGEAFYAFSAGLWTPVSTYAPYLKVQMTGCF